MRKWHLCDSSNLNAQDEWQEHFDWIYKRNFTSRSVPHDYVKTGSFHNEQNGLATVNYEKDDADELQIKSYKTY